jgi:membrane-associated protease RseP (regulator of RpoE activity)
MHGVIARAEKIRLKSVGLLLLAIFPGAFVEPDEGQLKRSKLLTRLRIFAAGSFANFSVAILIIVLFAFLIWPLASGTGAVLETVTPGSPAALAGLAVGQTLSSVNGHPITSSYWEFLGGRGYLYEEVGTVSAGDSLTFVADGKEYAVVAADNPETGAPYVGINYSPVMHVPFKEFLTVAYLFDMIRVFSLAVGLVNILPIYPLDGGLMFEAVAGKYLKKRAAKTVTRVVTYFIVLVLLFDFVGPWLMHF